MDFLTILQVFDGTLRLAVPLLLACLAGLFSERAGIFDIGLEGKMLAAAATSAALAALSGSILVGVLTGVGISVLLSGLHGVTSITFRGNQIVSGVAINFLAAGLTVVVLQSWFGLGGRSPQLGDGARFEAVNFPGAVAATDMANAGALAQIYSELLSGHTLLVYLALLLVPLSWFVLYRTRFGLRLRAVGENPAAVDTAGISVVRLRYVALVICGILCGLAGVYLSTAMQAGFTKDMSSGRGFIALAALIFAKWRPWYALGSCLFFGFLFAVDNRFQNIELPVWMMLTLFVAIAAALVAYVWNKDRLDKAVLGGLAALLLLLAGVIMLNTGLMGIWSWAKIPVVFIQSLPYLLTVIVLAGFVGAAIPPKAGGQPYVKET